VPLSGGWVAVPPRVVADDFDDDDVSEALVQSGGQVGIVSAYVGDNDAALVIRNGEVELRPGLSEVDDGAADVE
jgi:hypothetical protein